MNEQYARMQYFPLPQGAFEEVWVDLKKKDKSFFLENGDLVIDN